MHTEHGRFLIRHDNVMGREVVDATALGARVGFGSPVAIEADLCPTIEGTMAVLEAAALAAACTFGQRVPFRVNRISAVGVIEACSLVLEVEDSMWIPTAAELPAAQPMPTFAAGDDTNQPGISDKSGRAARRIDARDGRHMAMPRRRERKGPPRVERDTNDLDDVFVQIDKTVVARARSVARQRNVHLWQVVEDALRDLPVPTASEETGQQALIEVPPHEEVRKAS